MPIKSANCRTRGTKLAALVSVLLIAGSATAREAPALKLLYDQHRWFELREAIKNQEAPSLYKGVVASAFNDTKAAEKYLYQTISREPNSDCAEDAHEKLADLYIRLGRYHEAVQQLDQALRIKPASADIVNARAIFTAWSRHRDQSTEGLKSISIRADVSNHGVKLPVSIHGKTVHWLLDTGANLSVMSESEARMLGTAIDESPANVSDSAGGTTKIRTAVVDDLAIGGVHLRSVGFLVLPDSQEPMSDLPAGERGIIGIPVVVALQSIRWSADGTFEIQPGSHGSGKLANNLSFDALSPVTRVQFEGKELDCILDSGADAGSQLWTRFANDFAPLLKERGKKSKQQITMVGGSNARETIALPEIELLVGGLNTTLRPAQVFSKPIGDEFHHGLLGMDVLSQARRVSIDFRAMTLELLP
jgi:hypothetical protein